jgi:hypothetical protein
VIVVAAGDPRIAAVVSQVPFLVLSSATYRTSGYAVASDTVELHAATGGWDAARALFGTVRIRASSTTPAAPVFLGIARAGAASGYLAGVAHATIYGPPAPRAGMPSRAAPPRQYRRPARTSGTRTPPGPAPRPWCGRCAAATGQFSR